MKREERLLLHEPLPRGSQDRDGTYTAASTRSEQNAEKDSWVEELETVEGEVANNGVKKGAIWRAKMEEVWRDFSGWKRNGRMIESAFGRVQ